jgi:hypothetical protein
MKSGSRASKKGQRTSGRQPALFFWGCGVGVSMCGEGAGGCWLRRLFKIAVQRKRAGEPYFPTFANTKVQPFGVQLTHLTHFTAIPIAAQTR